MLLSNEKIETLRESRNVKGTMWNGTNGDNRIHYKFSVSPNTAVDNEMMDPAYN